MHKKGKLFDLVREYSETSFAYDVPRGIRVPRVNHACKDIEQISDEHI